jgi:hypothetical protein
MSVDRFVSGAEFVACWHALAGKTQEASTSSVCSPNSGGRATILLSVRDSVTG